MIHLRTRPSATVEQREASRHALLRLVEGCTCSDTHRCAACIEAAAHVPMPWPRMTASRRQRNERTQRPGVRC